MLKDLLKRNLEDGFFYFQLHNVFIRSKIKRVVGRKTLTKYLIIEFENGNIDIHSKTRVTEIKRPKNIFTEFEWCYEIRNEDDEFLGYIGNPLNSPSINQI